MEDKVLSPDQLTEREQEILGRLSNGLSNQEIADELYLSLNTVKWYNRQIYSKLGVSSRTQAIVQAKTVGIQHNGNILPPLPTNRHNLPAPTKPFIGREREIAEVKLLLGAHRLVTLTGSGGTGKTRLVLRLAAEIAEAFTDGVYFVDLASLSDHTQVAKTIAGALGVVENSGEPLPNTLKRVLTTRELLLVIDNFEHVIQAACVVSELLTASPYLKVLVTSREALRLSGEQEYPVPPLTLPTARVVTVQSVMESEAGALFVQRAQMSTPHFEVNDDNAPTIAEICARLDGLPLALELAAARCKLLTVRTLLELLGGMRDGSPLRALNNGSRDAPPRQRTLSDSIEWSYNLLEDDEKRLFARLAVFRGGSSLEAIEAICSKDLSIDVFDGLASLADKSLVQQKETTGSEPRFSLLEMIREYAREQLEASGEAEAMRRLRAEYFVELGERAEPELRLARYDYWCQRFELELDNIRAVLEWSLRGGDVVLGVRLATALGLFWYGKGHHIEGIRWTGFLLERLDETPAIYHPKFFFSTTPLIQLHDLDAAKHLHLKALALSRELDDKLQTAWALIFLGYTMQREPGVAIATAEESLALFRELNYQPGIAQALNIIGEIARINGDDDRAKRTYEECLAVCQQTGETRRICYMCNNLAYIAQHEGDHERVLDLGLQSLRLARGRKDRRDMATALAVLAGSIGELGQPQRAARLLGVAEAAYERAGSLHQPADKPEYDRVVAGVRAQLDEATFQAAWVEGRKMKLEEAVDEVLHKQP